MQNANRRSAVADCKFQIGGSAFSARLLAILLVLAPAANAFAQVGDEIPGANYYVAVQSIYAGEYRDAERELRRETQRGLRSTLGRWVDSVCYHAMLGEVLYHQGRNAEALAQFDDACQYIRTFPNWLTRVNFQRPPQPDANLARRVAPWGQSTRGSVLAQFPRTEQVAFGQLDNSQVVQRGGVFMTPEYRRVNIAEIVRASALALRRRAELLGPLAPHDPLFKDLSAALARGNLTPPNHWSIAWIELERGLVYAAMGQLDQAGVALNRATIVGGQFDHPLTCVALLEQARLAMRSGNGAAAGPLLAEAGFSAYYYENWDVLTESVWLGWVNHLAHGGAGVYPPLEPVAAWAQINRLLHISVKLRLAQAESLLWLGQVPAATALLNGAARPLGPMSGSLASIHHLYLQAVALYLQGKPAPGGDALSKSLTAQAAASLRNFQIGLTGTLFDNGPVTSRIAIDVYGLLLGEPTPADWAYQPLDVMAVLMTPHDAAFDRWFRAALDAKRVPLAIDVAERAKRRRVLATLPMGGRLVALRTILEAPERELSQDAALQRQQFLANVPAYRELSAAGSQLQGELRAGPLVAKNEENTKPLADRYDAWAKNAEAREQLIMQLALRRLPSSLEFPRWQPMTELQKSLVEGQALVVFHAAGGELYGFLITNRDARDWKLGQARIVRTKLADFLKDVGNYSAGRTFSVEELKRTAWQKAAHEMYNGIFAESRLDLANTKELVIIPDDVLWYLPFEMLLPETGERPQVLAGRMPIRYGPTAALVVGNDHPLRRPQRTGIVGTELNKEQAITAGEDLLSELEKRVAGPVRLAMPLAEPGYLVAPLLDSLIVLDDVSMDRAAVAGWSPLPRSSAGASDTLESWLALPYGGPERVVMTSFTTEAEQGLKPSRRGAGPPGSEVFQTLCRFMANGARTMLLTRWRTNGRTNFDLVREFVQELPHEPAADAWRRAVVLAREGPLDIGREPRLKRSDDKAELPTADHPFFWAGYLLVDTGARPGEDVEQVMAAGASGSAMNATPPAPPLPPPTIPQPPQTEPKPEGGSPKAKVPEKSDAEAKMESQKSPMDVSK
ncbi:MAG: CHAT domain-containing protein [Pirellulales bacterium]